MATNESWEGPRATMYRELLEEQAQSGLSLREFAELAEVSVATLYAWRRKLGMARVRTRRTAESKCSLIELEVVGSEEERATEADESRGAEFRVDLPDGTRLGVPPGFDEAELARLIRVLAGC